jgi:hypothetical protein
LTIVLVNTYIKEEIIRKWLGGEQRDKIASDMSMGAGTVSNIISEWKEEIGIPTADTLSSSNRIKKIEYQCIAMR